MSNEKHTAEPWQYLEGRANVAWEERDTAEGSICANTDIPGYLHFIAKIESDGPAPSEDARRIVACVNACAGIPTEELETVANNIQTLRLILLADAARHAAKGETK